MSRILLSDLYDTVLKDGSFDFQRGMRYLYDLHFTSRCSWEEFREFDNTFYPLYEARKADNHEIALIRDEVIPIFEKFGVTPPADLNELEFQIMDHMQENTLLDEVRETLQELARRGVPMYILSNAVFSAKSARRLLDRFGIGQYFAKVYSSADYGVRKPGRAFFDLAVEEILAAHPNCRREDILYVGNDYCADAAGGMLADLDTVWYNVNHLSDSEGLNAREIDDFRKLLEVME